MSVGTGRGKAWDGAAAAALAAGLVWAACGGPPPAEGPAPGLEAPEAGPPPGAPPAEDTAVAREREDRARLLDEGALPEIPVDTGPLRLEVRYPSPGQRLTARDSNFVFGTVGTGDARLEVDGRPVPVEPNGAFLAWLPVPSAASGDTATYRIVARRGASADTARLRVLLPPPPFSAPPGTAAVDTSFLIDPPPRWALPGEALSLEVGAAPAIEVWLEAGGERFPLRPGDGSTDRAVYRGAVEAGRLHAVACRAEVAACGAGGAAGGARPGGGAARAGGPIAPSPVPAESASAVWPADTLPVTLVAAGERDTVRLDRRLPLRLLDPLRLPLARLESDPDPVQGRRPVVVGRPLPYGPYRWRFPPGAVAVVEGRLGDRLRLRLGQDLHAWVDAGDAALLPPEAPAPPATVADVRARPGEDRVTVRLGLSVPVPADVSVPEERTLVLTLYGARGATGRVAYGEAADLVESLRWEQLPGDRYRLEVRTREPVWGWRTAYERGDATAYEGPRAPGSDGADGGGSVLRLEVRRPPRIDEDDPLEGRRIAVDPGHPPAGAYGPTGLYEGDANLGVARRLAELLEDEGAEPILLRSDDAPLGLYERTARAEAAGAELFVSIHNNALPDGVRPFGREGSSTYYYQPHSLPLARAVQRGLLREMGLRDLGVLWGDLAVARQSWMPAVLAEGAFMMIPRHEAALRTEAFRERYARGVLRGLRDFLEERARRQGEDDERGENGGR